MRDATEGADALVSRCEIVRLFEAAVEGNLHAVALDLICDRMSDVACLIYRQDDAIAANIDILHRRLGGAAMPPFPIDLGADCALFREHRRQSVGNVFTSDALMPRDAFRATRFFIDWLSKAGDLDAGCGVVITRDQAVQTVLEIRYAAHDARRLEGHAVALLEQLSLPLVQASRIADLAFDAGQAQTEAQHFLELSSFPTFIVDKRCRLRAMNSRGESLLRHGSGLVLGMDRTLNAVDPTNTALLQGAVEQASLAHKSRSEVVALRAKSGRAPQVLTLTPLVGPSHGRLPCTGNRALQGQVAIIVIDGWDTLRIGRDTLWTIFGLTTRETELALALLEGRTLPEFAQDQSVSKQTLRNQLSSLLRKTGTSRQSELLALLLQMARALPL